MEASLFGCMGDMGSCCLTLWCPWITAAQNLSASRDEECHCCHCCAASHPLWTRANIRRKKNAQQALTSDFFVYCCCAPCAICQDARELKIMENSVNAQPLMQ